MKIILCFLAIQTGKGNAHILSHLLNVLPTDTLQYWDELNSHKVIHSLKISGLRFTFYQLPFINKNEAVKEAKTTQHNIMKWVSEFTTVNAANHKKIDIVQKLGVDLVKH